jgi:hypothetical protein
MAETTELQTLKNELIRTDIAPAELQKLAEDKSVEILQKINATTERIAESKELAEDAKNMRSGWFGKTRKKADATANAVVAANAALSEMNNLLQESIRFTCSSIQFAQVMHKTMAYMMLNGIKDTNGQITQLSNDSKEAVQLILDEADDFVTKQLAVEEKQSEMYRSLERLQNLFVEKEQIDEKQEKEIRLLVEYTKQKDVLDKEQGDNIQKITEELKLIITQKKAALVFSIFALVISLGTLGLFILRFYLQ